MNERIKLRTHHIKTRLNPDYKVPIFTGVNIGYKIGTPEERRASRQANQEAYEAVVSGNYEDIGENPDLICDACLVWFCPDSGVIRFNKDRAKRKAVFRAVRRNPRYQRALEQTSTVEELDELRLKLIDEYWKFF